MVKRRKREKKVDIAKRSTSKKRDLSGEFLEGTESSITKIESTGATSFAEAWNEEPEDSGDESLDAALEGGQEDPEARNLDQSRVATMAGWAIFIVGLAGLIFFVALGGFGGEGFFGARASTNVERNILASPLAEREYTSPEGPVVVENVGRLSEQFIDPTGSGDLERLNDPDEAATLSLIHI